MHDPRPSSPHWPTTVLPTVPEQDKYQRAGRIRLIVLGSAGAFLAIAIGYWAIADPGDDDTPAPVAVASVPVQVVPTLSIEPLEESSTAPTSKPPTSRPATQPATSPVKVAQMIGQMQRELGVLVRGRQLERDDARSLNQRLRKISESIRKNDKEKAVDRLADFAEKLDDLRDDEKISEAGFDALSGQAAQLATALDG
ncbi:FIMAH domain-containing protein [Actinoplanes sp. NPDC020271]|uniref:FIMAH domain-containing protein n=1 Tax=Actinoplanes sp. NPDC020271 TaxID=3363896 RepID=UPI00378F7C5D